MESKLIIPSVLRQPGTYTLAILRGRRDGDTGVDLTISRGATGVWPGAATDAVLRVTLEFNYGGADWVPVAHSTFYGGEQGPPRRFSKGPRRLAEFLNVTEWPRRAKKGKLVPLIPQAVCVMVEVCQALEFGAEVAWRSR